MTVNVGLEQADRFPIPGLNKELQLRLTDFSREVENIRSKIKDETTFRKLLLLAERIGVSDFFSPDSKKPHARDYIGKLADRYPYDTVAFLAAVALNTDTDIYSSKAEKVPLMTMHAAKGLEFPVVFIVGCEDNYLPFQREGLESADVEEERRLFYVAMTRARQQLFLSWACRRRIFGKHVERMPSPFLADIKEKLLEHKREGKIAKKKKEPAQKQMGLF
jgi:superfamily I DNA/RNA helicase